MVPMARAVHDGQYKRVVMVCSAQAGKTESLLDLLGARLDQRPAPILYIGPIRDFLTDQFEPRLMNLLDEAETLSAKVVRGRRMKKTLKIVAGVPVRLAHAGSSAALKSSPAALALVDEYDEMLANVKGQGDPLGLVEARGETYADFTGFKRVIRDTRADLFSRHLVRQLLTYTTGRTMELADDLPLDQLHDKVKKQGLGLNTIMVECLMSEIFRSR